MTLLDLYHLRFEVNRQLCELTLEQIDEVRESFQKMHPEEYLIYSDLFDMAISRKRDELNMKEIIALVEDKKSAPSSTANTEQGE